MAERHSRSSRDYQASQQRQQRRKEQARREGRESKTMRPLSSSLLLSFPFDAPLLLLLCAWGLCLAYFSGSQPVGFQPATESRSVGRSVRTHRPQSPNVAAAAAAAMTGRLRPVQPNILAGWRCVRRLHHSRPVPFRSVSFRFVPFRAEGQHSRQHLQSSHAAAGVRDSESLKRRKRKSERAKSRKYK